MSLFGQTWVPRVLRETVGSSADWNHFATRNKIAGAVNLGQGFCDFVPPRVSELLQEGIQETLANNSLNQYSDSRGLPRLREALSDFMNEKYAFGVGSEDVCVLPSATAALFAVVQAVVDPGDEVVIFEPFFPWYPAIVRAAGGVPRFVKLDEANDFALPPWDVVARSFVPGRTKLCIVNTPHNPTGRVATRAELEGLAQLCVEHDVVCLSDEVYESCIFPAATVDGGGGGDDGDGPVATAPAAESRVPEHIPIALLPGMAERTVTVGSASKLLSVTGWRVGWAITHSRSLLDVTATMHSFNTFCAPTPLQSATAHAVEALVRDATAAAAGPVRSSGGFGPGGRLDISGVATVFQRNARKITAVLEGLGLDVYPCESGYFVLADVKSTGLTGLEFCDLMLESDSRVIAFPMSLFYDYEGKEASTVVRFSICKTPEYIDAALVKLAQVPVPRP